MMNEVMLDIETLSTQPNASIASVGAVLFSRDGRISKRFYKRVDRTSCAELGMHEDPGTLEWWDGRSAAAKLEIFDEQDRFPISRVLAKFSKWYKKHSPTYIWANSPCFDCVIMQSAYRAADLPCPWKFYDQRDVRTVIDVAGLKKIRSVSHHALQDCVDQVETLCKAFV